MLDPIQMGFRNIRLAVHVFYDRASEPPKCSPAGNPCNPDFMSAILRASINPPAPMEPSMPHIFSDRGIFDAAIILGQTQAELNQCGPDFYVRVLRSSMGSNSLAFYLPPSIGLLKLNFRNAITLELHERSLLAGMLPGLRMSALCAFVFETCLFLWCLCLFFFSFFCFFRLVFFVVSSYKYHTSHA